jgi:DNA polymerase III subunit gamma/tau
MGKALYRKYRSKTLGEIVGQEHITTTLSSALKSGAISHAYLFTGPRGVGKTSIARILAHEINGLSYDEKASHLDIIEIDAASNRRIDEIRELRERVHISPANAKYKVYIIDEVHMLTKEAFNALLKTLEEPPAHAVFILATTEAHKLPETIISRTQRYTFKPIDPASAAAHLKSIASTENIDISDEALQLIAEHGDGSFRDSISLLDQARNKQGRLELDDVRTMLGIAPSEAIRELVALISGGEMNSLSVTLRSLYDQGYHAAGLTKQLSAALRASLLNGQSVLSPEATTRILRQLIDVPASHDPEVLLEIILFDAVMTVRGTFSDQTEAPRTMTDKQPAKQSGAETRISSKQEAAAPKQAIVPEPIKKADKKGRTKQTAKSGLDIEVWQEALHKLKGRHNTLYGLARMAHASFEGQTVRLAFAFPFHQRRLSDTKNRQLLVDVLTEITGNKVEIISVVDKSVKPEPAIDKPEIKPLQQDEGLQTISNIFGSAEVIE